MAEQLSRRRLYRLIDSRRSIVERTASVYRASDHRLSEPPLITTASMLSKPQNTIITELRQDFMALLIKIFSDLGKEKIDALRFYYEEDICETFGFLTALLDAGKFSWTNVSSLKKWLSAIGREVLVDALEEFEIKRNVALLLDAFVKIRKGIPSQNRFKKIEAIAWYLANLTDCALDKSKVRSLRKSKKNIEEVMIFLEEQIRETNLSKTWTYRLALLIVAAGEVLSETEIQNEEFTDLAPEEVARCSAEICSRMASLDEWDEFCLYVKERYNEVYCELDHSAIDVKKKVDDVIAPLMQTRFFNDPGNS
ncbi:uncharacterized protein LOC114963377 [Acropora millepora]|uniref:uncharacterized protein LOC114963377 n=1 Tax=Acropora millepora TaxID=45264 RepID=UPI001CF20AA8|nr:uncharacterized protein LOC114963377 [Acropora millepora]